MNDRHRILRQLQRGPVTSVDFLAPHVIDGGKPITRVAARILDLKKLDGCEITMRRLPNRVAQYRLVGMPPGLNAGLDVSEMVAARAGAPKAPPTLFDPLEAA